MFRFLSSFALLCVLVFAAAAQPATALNAGVVSQAAPAVAPKTLKDQVLLKNGREIFSSYESIMSIDGSVDQELQDVLRINLDRLPKTGSPEELSSSVVLATTEIAGLFCKKSITLEKTLSRGERTLFMDIDFKRGPSQFTDYLKETILDHLALSFWNRNLSDSEKGILSQMIDKANIGSGDAPELLDGILQVVCTTYATSLTFLVK